MASDESTNHNRCPLRSDVASNPVKLHACARVDAAGRLIRQEYGRIGGHRTREQNLLLVAARQI